MLSDNYHDAYSCTIGKEDGIRKQLSARGYSPSNMFFCYCPICMWLRPGLDA